MKAKMMEMLNSGEADTEWSSLLAMLDTSSFTPATCSGNTADTMMLSVLSGLATTCDDVNPGTSLGSPTSTDCINPDGTPKLFAVAGGAKYKVTDLCPATCSACGATPTEDAAVVAGGTCAGYAHFCTTEPLVAWMCPETCGPYPGDCVFLSRYGNGAARYAADCASSWSLWYASYQACMADSPNWVAGSDPSNPTACPMDPTGISCYQTDESLGSSASC